MAEDKNILFQGTGYRVVDRDQYNVKLEVPNSEGTWVFVGYYSNIPAALRAIVQRDILMDRTVTNDIKGYLTEIDRNKETIFKDIENHFNEEDLDDLFN